LKVSILINENGLFIGEMGCLVPSCSTRQRGGVTIGDVAFVCVDATGGIHVFHFSSCRVASVVKASVVSSESDLGGEITSCCVVTFVYGTCIVIVTVS